MADQGGTHRALLCDANVLIRVLTADHARQSPAARRALDAAGRGDLVLLLTDVIVAEVAYVLTSYYELSPSEAADRLLGLIALPGIAAAEEAIDALHIWASNRLDFADAYLAAVSSRMASVDVLSFDRDFDSIDGVQRVDPAQY